MNRKTRVGIIGGGGIVNAHAQGYRAAEDAAQVVAVAEPVADQAPRLRELFGDDITIYPDYHDLLREADVDAVDICLPHHLHLPATAAAAEAGRHVLVEKVMARNTWECDRMIEACERAGVTLTVCHDRRYAGEWMALKKVVDSGALGEITSWKLDHNQDVDPAARNLLWAADRDKLGGGAIMSCLTHQIDALRWFGGEIDEVTCMTCIVPQRMAGETVGVIMAKMRSGALAHLAVNWMTRSSGPAVLPTGEKIHDRSLWGEMVQVCGTRGEAYYMSRRGTFAMTHDGSDISDKVECVDPVPERGFAKVASGGWRGHVRCIPEWLKLVRGEPADVTTTGRDSRSTVEVAEAAYLSVDTGRHVSLPIEPRPWESTGKTA
jgi:predicted dehydrogenase